MGNAIQINFKLDGQVKKELEAACLALNENFGTFVRRAVENELVRVENTSDVVREMLGVLRQYQKQGEGIGGDK